ncbi:hypothetical protein F5B19DRAFT_464876 [Rostrohypoxylon terebratum]|nr:hypothetical protein F5B19DRAFT_464876 [Rostrohypoxylon terebratum]
MPPHENVDAWSSRNTPGLRQWLRITILMFSLLMIVFGVYGYTQRNEKGGRDLLMFAIFTLGIVVLAIPTWIVLHIKARKQTKNQHAAWTARNAQRDVEAQRPVELNSLGQAPANAMYPNPKAPKTTHVSRQTYAIPEAKNEFETIALE